MADDPVRVAEIAGTIERELGPLAALGYPSIGCSPCTSKVAEGEDSRSGRWRGWDKTECGIHIPGQDDSDGELPPDYDPVF